jgi:hypothetical protein
MKKFLLSVLLVTAIGFANKSNAQCAGANVTVYNIVFSQNNQVYNWSFDWIYNNGNASISVVYKCGGVVVASEPCLENLNDYVGGSEAGSYDFSGGLVGAKEIEIRIYASSNCHGTFCPIAQSAPLPVTFASFDVRRGTGDNVNLSWSTALEINNYGFYVERNVNGKWSPAGFVPSQAVGGNSESLLSYSFVDLNNVKGITQYRIRQVDIDGRFKYTEIRTVRGEDQAIRLTVYPNPSVDGRVNVVFDDAVAVRNVSVLDMSGRVVRQVNGITNNNITIENLNPGMYTVRVVVPETGAQGVQKIIVNKR